MNEMHPTNAVETIPTAPEMETAPVAAPPLVAPMLSEGAMAEPPRALTPGAFLKSQYEVREVVARGWTNLYLAIGGDYGNAVPKLIAERETSAVSPPPVALRVPQTPDEPMTPSSNLIPGALLTDSAEWEHGIESGAMGSEAGIFDAPHGAFPATPEAAAPVPDEPRHNPAEVVQIPAAPVQSTADAVQSPTASAQNPAEAGEIPAPPLQSTAEAAQIPAEAIQSTAEASQSIAEATQIPDAPAQVPADVHQIPAQAPHAPLELPSMMTEAEEWEQDGRQYRAWDWIDSVALQDHRESPNDERYLEMLSSLAELLAWARASGGGIDTSRELLRVDENGDLRYFGFLLPSSTDHSLDALRELDGFLIERVFADSATMRLDDRFAALPMTEEVRDFARRLADDEFISLEGAHDAIRALRPSRRVRSEVALHSDVGRERELNEDSGMVLRMQRESHLNHGEFNLYVVADGMGGHEGGEVASDLTMLALQQEMFAASRGHLDWNDNGAIRQWLLGSMETVNNRVVELTQSPAYRASRAKPGSTLTFALQIGARVFVGNVGDSRAFKWNATQGLTRISKDHSYVQTLIDAGSITEEEAFVHPDGSIITAHIGDAKGRTRDVFMRLMAPGDKLLLVSDGVTDMLRDRDIAPFLQENDPEIVCRNLVDASNAAGGLDNITALCVTFY